MNAPNSTRTSSRRRLVALTGAACTSLLFGTAACGGGTASGPSGSAGAPAVPGPVHERPAPDGGGVSLLELLDSCDVYHRGLLLDVGSPRGLARRSFEAPWTEQELATRGNATFARLTQPKSRFHFWLDRAHKGDLFVGARLQPQSAKDVAFFVDDRHVGAHKFKGADPAVVRTSPIAFELERGRHTLSVVFRKGGARDRRELFADLDWLRIGADEEGAADFSPPTARDIVGDYDLGGRPRRSLVLRAPTTVRCHVRPTKESVLRVSLGHWGAGSGLAEVRVVRNGEPPVGLLQRRVAGGDSAVWRDVELPLGELADEIVGLELQALEGSPGGRVVFGEPRIERRAPPPTKLPAAQLVVVVVFASTGRNRTPPWAPIGTLEALGALARESVAFDGYRLPSASSTPVLASLLTGLPLESHRVDDAGARLSERVPLLALLIKATRGRTAFFTGVPTSFRAFGFDRGWDKYEESSPVRDQPAIEPITAGARWLDAELNGDGSARRLLVIHARGAHPPWDLEKNETQDIPPPEYGGLLTPRRAGVVLNQLRHRRDGGTKSMHEEDWVRLHVLEELALTKQSAAVGELIGMLKRRAVWDRTLFVLTSDGSSGGAPRAPYAPSGPLVEDRLVAPLLLKLPEGRASGTHVGAPAEPHDVALTVLRSLEVPVPESVRGRDLVAFASGVEPPLAAALVASTRSEYSARVGTWQLSGRFGAAPFLCELGADPACLLDQRDRAPLVSRALWQWVHDALLEQSTTLRPPLEREPATPDEDTISALTAWGDL